MKRMGNDGEGSDDFAMKVAKVMRDFARAALEDPRKQQADLDILDGMLSYRASELFTDVLRCTGRMYSDALAVMPGERNMLINKALVDKTFNPVIAQGININTAFTDFYGFQIKELPGYIKLHEAAKAMDVAINVAGLTAEEKRAGVPRIVINVLKSYEEGEEDTKYGYPYPADEPEEEEVPAAAASRRSLKPGLKNFTM